TVTGSGLLNYPSDKFFYAYKPLNGDATVIARIASAQYSGQALVGVMIRESLTAGSKYALAGKAANNQIAVLHYRADNLDTYSQTGSTYLALPMWVKLLRQGNVFTAYGSSDGVTWTQAGTVTLTMGSSVWVGLVSSPQDAAGNNNTASATFDSV